jgi:hypothetical protein
MGILCNYIRIRRAVVLQKVLKTYGIGYVNSVSEFQNYVEHTQQKIQLNEWYNKKKFMKIYDKTKVKKYNKN